MSEPTEPRPGPESRPERLRGPVRWAIVAVVAVVVLVVLFTWVFPWLERNLSNPTLGG